MKLVRARPNAVEDLPEWAKCCPEYIAANQAIGEIEVDLEDVSRFVTYCGFCRSRRETTRIFGFADKGNGYYPIELLEIDETGVPDGNYVEAVAP